MEHAIPNQHDDPPKLLLWDFDQAMIVMIGMTFGIVAEMLLAGIVCSLLVARWYGQKKVGRHRMFVLHLMYWYLPSDLLMPFPSLPPSSTREFIG
jgi:conjugal transfer pilus assembly protein TraL